MGERDPRDSPQKGDVIVVDGHDVKVLSRRGKWLTVETHQGRSYTTIQAWRKWMSISKDRSALATPTEENPS